MYIMKGRINKISDLIKNRRHKILNLIFLTASVLIIMYALFILLDVPGRGIISFTSGTAFFLAKIVINFSYLLFIKTFPFIFPPALLYLAACLLLKKRYLRYYSYLFLFSCYIIWFIKFVLNTDCFLTGCIFRLPEILTALVQIYIFLCLIMPDFMLNMLASVFFLLKSFLVFIMPDLPFRYDDFGMILALFIFTFLYLNNIVFLIKRAGRIILLINLSDIFLKKSGGGINGHDKK